MIRPEKITACSADGNALSVKCARGMIHIIPYGPNILRYIFDPAGNGREACLSDAPWGISAGPDSEIPMLLKETGDSFTGDLPELHFFLNKDTGTILFSGPEGKELLSLLECSLEPAEVLGEQTFHIRAVFSAPEGERYYGLGQHQDGVLDLGGREQILWHDYSHKGGEIIAVPFLISSRGYGIIFDNPSRMKVFPGMNKTTVWEAEVGETISFFLISGRQTDDIYRGYRLLCGAAPLPPRRGLGFIQCRQRYASQDELLAVASSYHEKKYPCDIFVVDWFHWKVLGDMSLDPEYWPDSSDMNRRLEEMGYETMISCWPRFMKESANYDFLEKHGWFMKDSEGHTVYGTPDDQRGALIDTTDPACGKWYFETIRKNYADLGYKYWWTDEDEPDISPHESFLSAGTGARIHNIYPLTHTRSIYEGHRSAFSWRCLTLSRSAYLGAQQYGTTFWSSDIFPEWDVLKRQIPTALNFCASGMPYWSSDIGGWQALPDEESQEDYHSLLINTSSDGKGKVTSLNYPELYVRWFQFGVFCPTFRTHGTRKGNEVWSYGKTAEQILVKYLKLRYRLMPYIYSLAYQTFRTGAPFMRALWMDFKEPQAAAVQDQFMFGPALLIAPVTEQGARSRQVYLPAGHDWYDFRTGSRFTGGQTILADAPLDTIPVYVKAGSILPMGEEIENNGTEQKMIELHVYPGKDAEFALYSDDGCSYAYENGAYSLIRFIWSEQEKQLSRIREHTYPGDTEKWFRTLIFSPDSSF